MNRNQSSLLCWLCLLATLVVTPAMAQSPQTAAATGAQDQLPPIWKMSATPETWDQTHLAWLHIRVPKASVTATDKDLFDGIDIPKRTKEQQEHWAKYTKVYSTLVLEWMKKHGFKGDGTNNVYKFVDLNGTRAGMPYDGTPEADEAFKKVDDALAMKLAEIAYFAWDESKTVIELGIPVARHLTSQWPLNSGSSALRIQDFRILQHASNLEQKGGLPRKGNGSLLLSIQLDGQVHANGSFSGKAKGAVAVQHEIDGGQLIEKSAGSAQFAGVDFVLSRIRGPLP